MEEQASARRTLCRQLGITDTSLGFLLLLVVSLLLSFWSAAIQRQGLCLTIQGETAAAEQLPDVFPLKKTAAAIVVGALGFFLCLALAAHQQAGETDNCVAKQSAQTNLWASLFVLVAGMLRLADIQFVQRCQRSLEAEDTFPD